MKTILIVEDNYLNMKLFNDLLQTHGYDTLQANDGRQAFELARDHMPDLILLDIRLPGINGVDLTKMLKANQQLRHIPIIAVTAFSMRGGIWKRFGTWVA